MERLKNLPAVPPFWTEGHFPQRLEPEQYLANMRQYAKDHVDAELLDERNGLWNLDEEPMPPSPYWYLKGQDA